jgi:hypothetical protein
MSTFKVDVLQSRSGGTTTFTGQVAAKQWCSFNTVTTTTMRNSFNTTSLTDNGTGDTTVTFTNAMADANYAFLLSVQGVPSGVVMITHAATVTQNPTTTATRLISLATSFGVGDTPIVNQAIIT